MDFSTHKPVCIITGEECLVNNGERIAALGKKAYVVTGKRSADACGAMNDVNAVLGKYGIPYVRMNRVTENPPAEMCHEAGRECRENGCDFVVAIGGGSAIDAAKAIAAYAANPEADVMDIYDPAKHPVTDLPLCAVPTTAGTGSETNYYSVLTISNGSQKKTYKSPNAYPNIAFVDPRYTHTLSREYTVSTALDALAHAIESYLSPKSCEASMEAALFAAKEVWDVIFRNADADGDCDEGGFTAKQRERLMYASTAAGIAIDYTGTGFPHPLGYSVTLTYGIPHGRACAAFEGAFLRYNMLRSEGRAKIEELAAYVGADVEEMIRKIPEKGDVQLNLTAEQREEMIDRVAGAGNYANSWYIISRGEMSDIYERLFG
ncbi:MAG: iron-containing alcohol dehydrogenase [Ruminococcaceae bacterium]|nr:iron-containing alcohol dehydrogenase [Oscillospiraceae bacterium]